MSLHEFEGIQGRLRSVADPVGFLTNLFAHAPVGFAVWTADGHPLLTNRAFIDIFLSEPPPEYNVLEDELLAKNGMLPLFKRAFAGETVHVPTFWYDPRDHTAFEITEGRRVAVSMTIFPLFRHSGEIDYVAATYKDETDIMLAAEQLRLSKDRQHLAEQAAQVGTFEWNVQTGVNTWTPTLEAMHGLAPGEFGATQQSWENLIHPEDRDDARARVAEAFESFKPVEGEWRVVWRDGSVHWLVGRFQVFKDPSGKPHRLVGVNVDITDRKNADERRRVADAAVKASEEDLRVTLQSIGDAVIATDASGLITRMNPVAELLTGWKLADARGRRLAEVFDIRNEDTRELVESPVEHVLREGKVVGLANHTVLVARDGSERAIADSGAPIRDEAGELRGVVLVFHDQTEQRRATRALEESEARFRHLAESGIIGIIIADTLGNVHDANDAFLSIVGFSREELTSGHVRWADMTPPEWRHLDDEAIEQLAATGVAPPWEKEYVHKDGTRVPVVVGVTMLNASRCIAFVLDVSERRRTKEAQAMLALESRGRLRAEEALKSTEKQLQHAQRMDAVGRLAGGVAHDFNNVLSVVVGYAEVVLNDLREGDPMRTDLEQLLYAGRRGANLTQQLLAFSRQQVLAPTVVDLNQTFEAMRKMLHRLIGEDIELVLRTGSTNRVRVDQGQMEQVLMNLVVNARDAMPRGGKLTIETADVDLDADYVTNHIGMRPGAHVVFSVSDTGVGMDEATQARIFEPFFTTKGREHGTGLGLSTAFGIIQQSGGSIWVYSELGNGTTFKVYLPAVADAVETDALAATRSPRSRGTETVLLVEDDDLVRAFARKLLKRHGYRVLEAASGGDALVAADQYQGTIHLLLTDVVMPRMSGRELAERLSPGRPGMKVLFMSGYTDDHVVRHGVLSSETAFVQKPLQLNDFLAKLRELLDTTPEMRRDAF